MHTTQPLALPLATLSLIIAATTSANAQYAPPQPVAPYPAPPQAPPYAQQPAPQAYPPPNPQQPAPQAYPPPYPQQPAPQAYPPPYPQQPAPQAYPPPYPQQPTPQAYPPPGYALPQPGVPQPYAAQQRPLPPVNRHRSDGEMLYLYGTGIAYGVGSGIWTTRSERLAIRPLPFCPRSLWAPQCRFGIFVWDQNDTFDRGVPSSIATGMLLGGVEGMAVSGLQWQLTGNGGPNSWGFSTWTTLTFVGATAGALGGYGFGEWLQPDPRTLSFIASAAGWGTLAGVLFGAGVVGGDWSNGASGSAVGGFAGYNTGILAAGVLSTVYVPSSQTLKYMWLGELLGTAATLPVYAFYVGGGDPRHGLVANAVGGLAGLGIATALTANMTDGPATASWSPPFQVAFSPSNHGGQLTAFGQF